MPARRFPKAIASSDRSEASTPIRMRAHGGAFGRGLGEDRPRWPVGEGVAGFLAGGQEARQVVTGELARGRPQRGSGDTAGYLGMCAVEVTAQVQRRLAGHQDAAQHATARARSDRGAGFGGDRLGGSVGLLGGETALFDRPRSGVAGGEHVAHTGHAAVRVDRDEPVGVSGQAGDVRSSQAGERDHRVGCDHASVAGQQRAADHRFGHRLTLEDDARTVQEARKRVRCHGAEQVQRSRLGRDDPQLGRVIRGARERRGAPARRAGASSRNRQAR